MRINTYINYTLYFVKKTLILKLIKKYMFLTIEDGSSALSRRHLRKPVYEHHSGQRLIQTRSARCPWSQRFDGDSFVWTRLGVQHEAYVSVNFDRTAIGAKASGESSEFQLVLTWNFTGWNLISLVRDREYEGNSDGIK